MGEVDVRIRNQAPTTEEEQVAERVKTYFLKLAGEDKEIDWCELKNVLDFAMNYELPTTKAEFNAVESNIRRDCRQQVHHSQNQNFTTETNNNNNNNILNTLLGLICARFCKDTPLADIIPAPASAPTVQSVFPPINQDFERGGFSKDICRSMVAMLDVDRSGKLGFEEFLILWSELKDWKNVYQLYDKDNSGALSGFELRQALNSAGFKLNNRALNIIMHRFGDKKSEIKFDDFIMCAIKLKTMLEKFKEKDPEDSGSATFSLEEWVETTIYT